MPDRIRDLLLTVKIAGGSRTGDPLAPDRLRLDPPPFGSHRLEQPGRDPRAPDAARHDAGGHDPFRRALQGLARGEAFVVLSGPDGFAEARLPELLGMLRGAGFVTAHVSAPLAPAARLFAAIRDALTGDRHRGSPLVVVVLRAERLSAPAVLRLVGLSMLQRDGQPVMRFLLAGASALWPVLHEAGLGSLEGDAAADIRLPARQVRDPSARDPAARDPAARDPAARSPAEQGQPAGGRAAAAARFPAAMPPAADPRRTARYRRLAAVAAAAAGLMALGGMLPGGLLPLPGLLSSHLPGHRPAASRTGPAPGAAGAQHARQRLALLHPAIGPEQIPTPNDAPDSMRASSGAPLPLTGMPSPPPAPASPAAPAPASLPAPARTAPRAKPAGRADAAGASLPAAAASPRAPGVAPAAMPAASPAASPTAIPASASHLAAPHAAATPPPPSAVLFADLQAIHVSLRYQADDPAARTAASRIAALLTRRGVATGRPVPAAHVGRSSLAYRFPQDRGAARLLAALLLPGAQALRQPMPRTGLPPRPGEVAISIGADEPAPGAARAFLPPWQPETANGGQT